MRLTAFVPTKVTLARLVEEGEAETGVLRYQVFHKKKNCRCCCVAFFLVVRRTSSNKQTSQEEIQRVFWRLS
jgi:hypothetical protein